MFTHIRPEEPADAPHISVVLKAVFPSAIEATLVNLLRAHGKLEISLVATTENNIVGHIAFSPVVSGVDDHGLGLAPVAVLPEYQGRGIGSKLILAGIQIARARNHRFLVVLGEPGYYARFGFKPGSSWGLSDEYGGFAAFQALELVEDGLAGQAGLVRYAEEFAQLNEDRTL